MSSGSWGSPRFWRRCSRSLETPPLWLSQSALFPITNFFAVPHSSVAKRGPHRLRSQQSTFLILLEGARVAVPYWDSFSGFLYASALFRHAPGGSTAWASRSLDIFTNSKAFGRRLRYHASGKRTTLPKHTRVSYGKTQMEGGALAPRYLSVSTPLLISQNCGMVAQVNMSSCCYETSIYIYIYIYSRWYVLVYISGTLPRVPNFSP